MSDLLLFEFLWMRKQAKRRQRYWLPGSQCLCYKRLVIHTGKFLGLTTHVGKAWTPMWITEILQVNKQTDFGNWTLWRRDIISKLIHWLLASFPPTKPLILCHILLASLSSADYSIAQVKTITDWENVCFSFFFILFIQFSLRTFLSTSKIF